MKRVAEADGALVGQISGTFNLAGNQPHDKNVS